MPTTMRIFLYQAVPNAVISERINDICGINPNAKNKNRKWKPSSINPNGIQVTYIICSIRISFHMYYCC